MTIQLKTTPWRDIADNTGAQSKGRYVPAGQHRCQMCYTYDDPRSVSIRLPNHNGFHICVTCGKDYLLPLLLQFFTLEELEGTADREGYLTMYPKNPYEKKEGDPPPQLPANHPKVLQERLNASEQSGGESPSSSQELSDYSESQGSEASQPIGKG